MCLRTIETKNLPCFEMTTASKDSSFVACSPQLGSTSSSAWHGFRYFRGKNQMEAESTGMVPAAEPVPKWMPRMQRQQKQHQRQRIGPTVCASSAG
mmetsp:Transcript_52023/g.103354  ORF Transcript_52023/g.103354 Transcript_52023/m.103354 type:complete len:96 (-) Transcript_52023:202-489(-)